MYSYGSIITKDNTVNTSTDAVTWIEGSEETVNIKDITTISPWYDSMFTISLTNNVLSIKVNCTLESYLTDQTRVSSSKVQNDNKFYDYVDDNWYYEITVTEINSGLKETIKVRPVKSVTGVSMSMNEYEF